MTKTLFATLDTDVDEAQAMRLPSDLEAVGRTTLSRKMVGMFLHAYEQHLEDYAFFMKADDDT